MQNKVPNVVNVNIVVADNELDQFAEIVDAMRRVGLSVEEQDAEFGFVSGAIETEKLPALGHVHGVGAVEEERSFQLAPPWSDTQ
jgi:hypothetical protein